MFAYQINNVLSTLKPRKSVVFAFDGSAPLAKLLTQRSRREENRRADRYGLSALHLTPGTAFMDMMAESMRYYAFMRLGATVSCMLWPYNKSDSHHVSRGSAYTDESSVV
jgi:5'-3' exonuclease